MLDVVANNLANVNTVGFKGSRALFEEAMSSVLSGNQVGLGVSMSEVSGNFQQAGLQFTGLVTDLSVVGEGFFVLEDAASGATYYARDGSFGLDDNGYLIADEGMMVQGSVSGTDGSALAPLQIIDPAAALQVETFSIDMAGKITVLYSDGTSADIGHVTLQTFVNPQALDRAGANRFTATSEAGARFAGYQTPGTDGLGEIRSGYLEMSNVDMAEEFTSMIRAQRGLQANARIISTADEVLQEIANLKR